MAAPGLSQRGQVVGIDIPIALRVAQRIRGAQLRAVVTWPGEKISPAHQAILVEIGRRQIKKRIDIQQEPLARISHTHRRE